MIWVQNPAWISWSVFMTVGTLLSIVASRRTDFGEHLPMTGGFGREISLWRGLQEMFRFPTMLILTASLVALCILRLLAGNWSWWDAAAVGSATVLYPFGEWWFHTRISHSKPLHLLGGLQIESVFSRYHHSHHHDPYNRTYAISPMVTFLQYVFFVPGISYLLLPSPYSLSFAGMTVALIFRYEAFHFLFHAPYKPRSKWFRKIRDHHLWHHFQNEAYWYNIADPLADRVLGTELNPKQVPRSPTCRNLAGSEPSSRSAESNAA